jgi:hypothetical protein
MGMLKKRLGKALFIDEAYRLGEGQFENKPSTNWSTVSPNPDSWAKLLSFSLAMAKM